VFGSDRDPVPGTGLEAKALAQDSMHLTQWQGYRNTHYLLNYISFITIDWTTFTDVSTTSQFTLPVFVVNAVFSYANITEMLDGVNGCLLLLIR